MISGRPSVHPRTAVFTIVSKNYLAYARVVMRSLEAVVPGWDRFVLLADRVDGRFSPDGEPFALADAETLGIPDFPRLAFRYTILEFNTAVKPWYFRALFNQGYDRVLYLDPDIFVYRSLSEVEAAWDRNALAVLVPHLTGRLADTAHPSEHDVLQAGSYNLGFCALARHPSLDALLDFWCEKSLTQFVAEPARGFFTDQRWMDLVPGMFPDVEILRHDGYDVAYWNLRHRQVKTLGTEVAVNGVPLVFFHFSGVDPLAPAQFSKHQDRYTLASIGDAAPLVRTYCDALLAAGHVECQAWPYAFGSLGDGSPIPDVLRRLYRTHAEVESWAGQDPFARTCADWNRPIDDTWPPITRVMLAVYQARPDLRLQWPDLDGAGREPFARWFATTIELEPAVSSCYIAPIRDALADTRPSSPDRSVSPLAPSVTPQLVQGALRKAYVATREGRLPLSPRRWQQLYRLHVSEHRQAELSKRAGPLPPIAWPSGSRRPGAQGDGTAAATAHPAGVTIVGYLKDGTGIAAGAYASAAVCADAGIAHTLIDARPLSPTRGAFPINLLHVNADQMPQVASMLGPGFFEGRRTIGVWAWELEELPDEMLGAFAHVDEVWAGSTFIQGAISAKAPVPVVHIPYPVTVAPTPGRTRASLGLPEDAFLFLVMYDVLSVQERKNPLGALEAFRRAFPDGRRARLVVRVNHASSRPDDVAAVRAAVDDTPGALLLDVPWSRGDAQALQARCDAFVSLHRSEGFGLNIAEAMLLGKPVIATGWSGNMDFTMAGNSCLVDHQLMTILQDVGPYRAGQRWADPDLAQAGDYMRRIVEDDEYRERIARRGQATIATEFSPAAIARRYVNRLAMFAPVRALNVTPPDAREHR